MRQAHPLYAIGLPMIAGGALGNLIDRIRFGSVVDFLDVHIQGHHWPAFNVADSAISMGVVVFFIANILEEKERRRSNVVGAIKEKKKGMQE
jgi:signal peptidase II